MKKKIGFAVCGSFCTISGALDVLGTLAENGYELVPIISANAATTDTRFGGAADIRQRMKKLCGRPVISTIRDAEPLGPREPMDLLIVCPCTGNTLAKLANGITDTPVTMAVKAHLRTDRPLLIALATNDAMSANLGNIGSMMRRKGVFFVPMKQDDCEHKPYSLVADFGLVVPAAEAVLNGEKQLRPVFLT